MLYKILAAFFTAISLAVADEQVLSPQQWLEKMNHAMKSLNFQGTVVFMKNGQLETMQYQHSAENGIEQERLSSLNSPLREATRKASEVSCLFRETSQKVINHHPTDSSFIINLPQAIAEIDKYYSLSLQGKESVAMLPTQIISVQPKDQLRYPRKIWIETQHFLPLKAEAYNQDGSTLDQMMFTNLQLVSDPAADFGVTNAKDLQVKHIHATQAEPFENASFMLKNWPAGFKTVFFMRNSLEQSQKSVDHLLISDGFSSVSVYLGPKENDTVEGLHSLGSVNSFSRVIDNSQITVLGEVPVQTVEFIANGITLR